MTGRSARATAFVSGACVLVLELVVARLLAPVFGSTVYVWSSSITVTLAALALGAWAGGLLADGPTAGRWPARLCAGAGLWLLAVPFLRRGVLVAAAGLGVKSGSLAAAAALVGPPLAALGALAPLCVKAVAADLRAVGRAAGGVSALSTSGSVLGALGAGFWLLPWLSAPVVVLASGALLLAAAGALALSPLRAGGAAAAAAAAALAAARALPGPGGKASLVRESLDSPYGALRVVDRLDWGRRVLYIDGVANTVVDPASLETTSDYERAFELAAAARPAARRALVVGLGGGAIVRRLDRGWRIPADVAEVDPAVEALARRWFGFAPTGAVRLEDGRRVLEEAGRPYGLIFLDAFAGDRNPEHLFSVEAFRAARARLEPGGLLVVNLIGYPAGPKATLSRAAFRTLSEVFPSVTMLVANPGLDPKMGVANLVFFAGDSSFDPGPGVRGRPELESYWASVKGRVVVPEPGGRLLTDDENPMGALTAPGMAEMRAAMLRRRDGADL